MSGAPITRAEMASLTRLEAPNSEISDLTGLEYAGLTYLDLGAVYVSRESDVNSNASKFVVGEKETRPTRAVMKPFGVREPEEGEYIYRR